MQLSGDQCLAFFLNSYWSSTYTFTNTHRKNLAYFLFKHTHLYRDSYIMLYTLFTFNLFTLTHCIHVNIVHTAMLSIHTRPINYQFLLYPTTPKHKHNSYISHCICFTTNPLHLSADSPFTTLFYSPIYTPPNNISTQHIWFVILSSASQTRAHTHVHTLMHTCALRRKYTRMQHVMSNSPHLILCQTHVSRSHS